MNILCKLGMHGHLWQDTNGRTSVRRCGRYGCDWVNDKEAAARLDAEREAVTRGDPPPNPYMWGPHR